MIRVTNLTKVYGKDDAQLTAVDDISLEIASGESVAIIGKSGSGKSTLMHLMSGLDKPTSGEIEIDGQIISSLKPRQMDKFRSTQMSFIFQSFFIEPNQTCLQNVLLPLEIARKSRRQRRERALQALKAVGLADKSDAHAVNLSGGQKQRLAIARAIVNRPQIIFADEPTGNLDSATGDIVTKLLFRLNKKLGCTLIIVTHDHDLAAQCQRRIHLKDGRIIQTPSLSGKRKGR
jgi:putative ABC transport system ATP-binding protein